LPPDLDRAFGDLFGIAFGEVDPPAVDLSAAEFLRIFLTFAVKLWKKR
jgi:hypothetical protein